MHNIAFYLTNNATDWQVIDTRPENVFSATGSAGQPGFRQGNISGSKNIPF